jgi:RNA polymerase sigma-70 factor (ECF subfamily)
MARWNEDSFSALIAPHLDRLYRLAFRLAGGRADAQDLLQDVLTKLYERRDELSSIRQLAPYLGRVLYNQFIDDRRRYGRLPIKLVAPGADVETLSQPAANGPEQAASAAQSQQRLVAALARLSEEHRVVVLLADSEGYTLAEIEALTGIALGTVKSRLHRGRARLREILSADGTFSGLPSCKPVEGAKRDAL